MARISRVGGKKNPLASGNEDLSAHVMMMKQTFKSLLILPLLLSSCGLFPSNASNADYRRGVAAGRAQEIRRQYWEEQRKAEEEPDLKRRYTPIVVPEHRSPDGLLIEEHTEYVETVY